MGLAASDQTTAYIVIVAPALTPDTPDISRVRAFLAKGNQAVTYGVGTWHSPMMVVGEKSIEFVVVQWVSGVAGEDCVECEGVEGVVVDVGAIAARAKL
ncbi:hypothetical protein HDU98_002719 [Podochytrium sp. JEL0797]|nr:hypothetical protein HDU98_002719 [Podochytrium sp. JEL0797]